MTEKELRELEVEDEVLTPGGMKGRIAFFAFWNGKTWKAAKKEKANGAYIQDESGDEGYIHCFHLKRAPEKVSAEKIMDFIFNLPPEESDKALLDALDFCLGDTYIDLLRSYLEEDACPEDRERLFKYLRSHYKKEEENEDVCNKLSLSKR